LNLFAFTGAFSVFAARGGATEVVTADLSATAIARGRGNLALNGLDGPGLEYEQDDSFRLLDRYRRRGRRFDLVLADPPPSSHGPGGHFSVERDLGRLTAACLRVLDEDGLLVLACNQGSVAPRAFQKAVEQGASRAGRRLYLLHGGSQPPDFPAAVHFPEGRYLKFGVWAASGPCA
jgi:23S rRNA (cytosine1962-C5)-methyltransferase